MSVVVVCQAHALQMLGLATVVSCLFYQTNRVQNLLGALFFVQLALAFIAMSSVTHLFPAERTLMLRERSLGFYKVPDDLLTQPAALSGPSVQSCPGVCV